MSMLVTTVHEDNFSMLRKDDVRRAWKGSYIQPKSKNKCTSNSPDCKFSRGIPLTNSNHHAAALFFRNDVYELCTEESLDLDFRNLLCLHSQLVILDIQKKIWMESQ
jgi:hypothetical protein